MDVNIFLLQPMWLQEIFEHPHYWNFLIYYSQEQKKN